MFAFMGTQGGQAEIAIANLTDNRQFRRIRFRVPVRAKFHPVCQTSGEAIEICHVLANDISMGGVSILCSKPAIAGQRIELDLPDGHRNSIACRVESVEGGRYLIGCRFEGESTSSRRKFS